MTQTKKRGKPPLTQNQIDLLFQKLEPYLVTGLSISRAVFNAGVPRSTVYNLYQENEQFADRVKAAQSFFTTIVNDIISGEIRFILDKQENKVPLSRDDRQFVQWIAVNNNAMKRFYTEEKEREDKDHERWSKVMDDEKCRLTVLETYEAYRQHLITDGYMTPEGQVLKVPEKERMPSWRFNFLSHHSKKQTKGG